MAARHLLALALGVTLMRTAVAQAPDVPQGGGSCADDWDCSLGGECDSGHCTCDVWWTGPQCDLLNLAPAESSAQGLQVPGYFSWGGHALPDPAQPGSYVGLFSFICNGSTLSAWTTKSSIWSARGPSPVGPFTLESMVSQPWAHNAMLSLDPSGTGYLLYQIGNAVTPANEWAPCYTPQEGDAILPAASPFDSNADAAAADAAAYRVAAGAASGGPDRDAAAAVRTPQLGDTNFTGQIYYRSSPTLSGPWSALKNVTITFPSDSWATQGAGGGNPAPLFLANGTALLFFTATPCPQGWGALAPNCIAVARSDSGLDGPWTALGGPRPITAPESEDPFVFRDPRGNFHLLTNVNTYHRRCAQGVPCGGHAWSRDGLAFSNLTVGAFGPVIRFANGSYWHAAYVERPQVLQDDTGRPIAFYVGIGRSSYMDSAGWAQSICAPGQQGCGPTHPPAPTAVRYAYAGPGGGAGLCLGTNSSTTFPCPGGWADSCPTFLVPCSDPTAVWLEGSAAGAGTLANAAVAGTCLNFDCNACAPGTLAKVISCSSGSAPLSFVPVSNGSSTGSLVAQACGAAGPSMCINGGQGTPVPPCKAGEQYLASQAKLATCSAPEAAAAWQRQVVPPSERPLGLPSAGDVDDSRERGSWSWTRTEALR